jgi:hypothetical protein
VRSPEAPKTTITHGCPVGTERLQRSSEPRSRDVSSAMGFELTSRTFARADVTREPARVLFRVRPMLITFRRRAGSRRSRPMAFRVTGAEPAGLPVYRMGVQSQPDAGRSLTQISAGVHARWSRRRSERPSAVPRNACER